MIKMAIQRNRPHSSANSSDNVFATLRSRLIDQVHFYPFSISALLAKNASSLTNIVSESMYVDEQKFSVSFIFMLVYIFCQQFQFSPFLMLTV